MTRITPAIIRELLDYYPDTGFFTWRERAAHWFDGDIRRCGAWNARYAGKSTFNTKTNRAKEGRYRGVLLGENIAAERVAWAHYYGEMPARRIAHRNGCLFDDSIANLELMQERGTNGIYRLPSGRWRAMRGEGGVWHHLGCYATREEAVAARDGSDLL